LPCGVTGGMRPDGRGPYAELRKKVTAEDADET
jgi:hypothetical protein